MKNKSLKKDLSANRIDNFPFFGRLTACLFLLVGLLIYSTSISSPFIWDDYDLVVENYNIQSWSHVFDLFKGNVVEQSSFYRPLQMFSYLLDYEIGGLNPKIFHFTSILIHIAVALSLCWLCIVLFKDRLIGMIAGLLFLIHPIHNEAVVYISGRADPLVALFMLLSFIYYIKHDETEDAADYIMCFGLSLLALLSKELAVILPGLFLVYHYSFRKKIKGHLFYTVSGLCLIYALLRLLNIVGVADMHTKTETILLERLPGTFYSLPTYLKLLIFPSNLFLGYGQKMFHWTNPLVWVGFCLYVFFFLTFFLSKDRFPKVSFLGGWFLMAVLPVMNIYPINAYMAEHWLYLPSMGVFILAAFGIKLAYEKIKVKDMVIAAAGLIFVVLSILTVRQNLYWKDPAAFYTRIIEINPDFIKAYNNLGQYYSQKDDFETASTYFKKAIEIDPRFEKGYHNYAACLAKLSKYDEAIEYYNRALQVNPNFAPSYNNLGALYIDQKEYDLAEQYVKKALDIKTDIPKAYYNLGLIAKARGNDSDAVSYFQLALKYDPNYTAANNNLAALTIDEGHIENSIQKYEEIVRKDPDNYTAINNLGILYGKQGDIDRSIEYFSKALSIKQDYADANFNIAYAFAQKGQPGVAIHHYRDAISSNPEHIQAINNLAILYAEQGQSKEAKELFLRALELEKDSPSAHNNLALVLTKLKEYDEAVKHYQTALKMNPKYKEAHNNLAMLYDVTGDLKEAEKHYQEAIDIDPNFTNALNGLGIIYGKEQKYKEAEKLFLRALEINPDGVDAKNNLQRARNYLKEEIKPN